jgi:hypothetical protein
MAVLAALLAAACASEAESRDTTAEGAITAGYLMGSWRGNECSCTLVYGDDGTYQIVQGGRAVEQGDFVVEGTSLTFISNDETVNCDPGDQLSLEVEVLDPSPAGADRIRQTLVEDDCSTRGGVPVVTLTRLP